jgi:type II secretory pathway component PulF
MLRQLYIYEYTKYVYDRKEVTTMELKNLYQFVLLMVLVGMILGVGILILDKFKSANTSSTVANTTVAAVVTAMATIASSWISLIITIAILAIILVLVIRSFSGAGR